MRGRLLGLAPLVLVLAVAACSSGGAAASSPGAVTTLRATESIVLAAASSVAPLLEDAAGWQDRVRSGEQRLPAVQAAAGELAPRAESLRALLANAAVSASYVEPVVALRLSSEALAVASRALATCVSSCAEHLAAASSAAAASAASVAELEDLLSR